MYMGISVWSLVPCIWVVVYRSSAMSMGSSILSLVPCLSVVVYRVWCHFYG